MREEKKKIKKFLEAGMAVALFSSVLALNFPVYALADESSEVETEVSESNASDNEKATQTSEELVTTLSQIVTDGFEVTANTYNISTDTLIHGTTGANVARVSLEVDGLLVRNYVPVNNQYGIYAIDKVQATNQQVYIVAFNSSGIEQNRTKVNLVKSAPILYGVTDKKITTTDTFDPLAGVTATDATGKIDLTNQIVVTGTVDTKTPGDYKVTYSINNDNIVTTLTITVTVVQAVVPVELTANEYNVTSGTFITGTTSVPNSSLRLEVDGKIVRNNVPNSNNFSIYAKDYVKSVNQQVYIVAFDTQNIERGRVKVNLKENSPILQGISDKTVELDSTFNPLEGVTALSYDGKVDLTKQIVVTGAVDTTKVGTYSVTYLVTSNGVTTYQTATIKVVETILAPTVDKYFADRAFATGKVEGSAQKVAIYVNGVLKRTAVVAQDRTFKIYTGDLDLKNENQTFEISAYGKTGVEGPKTTVAVESERYDITAQAFTLGQDVTVKGTIGENVTKVGLEVEGQLVRSWRTQPNRDDYIIYAGDAITSIKQNVYIISYDSNNIERSREKVTVVGYGAGLNNTFSPLNLFE